MCHQARNRFAGAVWHWCVVVCGMTAPTPEVQIRECRRLVCEQSFVNKIPLALASTALCTVGAQALRPFPKSTAMNKAVCTVYRTFFRYARQLQAAGQILDIREPVDKEAWQTAKHSWIVNDAASRKDTIHQLIPDIAQVPASGSFTPDTLRACIRANFAAGKDAPVDTQGLLLDQAFAALRILSEQMHMQQCSSHAVTGGIQVEVTSAFIGKVPAHTCKNHGNTIARNMFTYRVRITNVGDHKAQLLSRKWIIQDDQGKTVDQVAGQGVVGNTPVLKPYDCFQYYSSAGLESMQGAMHGTFQMLGYKDHDLFDAQITPFNLIALK